MERKQSRKFQSFTTYSTHLLRPTNCTPNGYMHRSMITQKDSTCIAKNLSTEPLYQYFILHTYTHFMYNLIVSKFFFTDRVKQKILYASLR